MKILFFLHFSNPSPSAAWTRISFFADYFSRKGITIFIAGVFSFKSLGRAGRGKWNESKIFNTTPIIMATNIFALIFNHVSSFFSSMILIICLKPDIVVISVPNGDCALGSYLAAKIFRKKILIDYRDEWEDYIIKRAVSGFYKQSYKFLKTLITRCYINSAQVVTVTNALANSLTERGVRNVKIISNGADTNVFKPYDKLKTRQRLGFDERDFIILYSGGIGEYYKLDIVVRALQKLINKVQNVKLLLVGGGPELQVVLNLSEDLGIRNRIFYLGPKSDKIELAEIISAADVGVVPYDANPLWKNSLPAKAFEYFACGLPVVATVYEDSTLGKLIFEHKIGLVSDPENVEALADCLERISIDNSFRKDASKKAVLLIEECFDRNKIAEKFLNLIKC
ncbi:MAG TPA: glycosyltransferase family 4 protein [Nitrosopumilaceae archaeon]|nr:glycosyltransferase family 4 protein [Nitrosopumilaceae archaeon]